MTLQHFMRTRFPWRLRTRTLELGPRTLVMGVVNVTPDSFSDGGQHFSIEAAIAHGLNLLQEGADILDIGGESTRPGANVAAEAHTKQAGAKKNARKPERSSGRRSGHAVSEEEESQRVLPVIEGILRHRKDSVISVDTYKAAVARAAVEAGAEIVNDVSAGKFDPQMPATMAELRCGCVLMHMRGRPEEWRSLPPSGDDELLALVKRELREWASAAMAAGVARERIVLDPGLGFGKNFEENYPLLGRMSELAELGFPLLVGASRKGFIGRALARDGKDAPVNERLYGTLAANVIAVFQGAHIVRAHDVRAAAEAVRVADAIKDL